MNRFINKNEVIRFVTGESSAEERKKIEEWMNKNFKNRKVVEQYQKVWKTSGEIELEQDEDTAWQKLSKEISRPNHLISVRDLNKKQNAAVNEKKYHKSTALFGKVYYQSWLLRIVAVLILTVCISFVLYTHNKVNNAIQIQDDEMRKVIADRGERVHVTFNDGTSVVLNSSSVIKFPSKFDGDTRQVELKGEAFFSVARKENMPFIVHTSEAVIQVLGTKFNVNAYPGDEKVEVVVADGKVAVRSEFSEHDRRGATSQIDNRGGSEVFLTRGEYTIVERSKYPSVPKKVVLEHYLGWINGSLIFKATPLSVVINKLELYYDWDFIVSDSTLFDRRLTASFDKESLSKVLDVLAVAMDLKYAQRDSLIFLKPYEREKDSK